MEAAGWGIDEVRLWMRTAGYEEVSREEWLARQRPEPEPSNVVGMDGRPDPVTQPGWQSKLLWNEHGRPQSGSVQNARIMIAQHPDMEGRLAYDLLRERAVWRGRPEWVDELRGRRQADELFDEDVQSVQAWLEVNGIKVSETVTWHAMRASAAANSFNPVADYLGALRWDGQPRIDTLFSYYFGAEDSPYIRAVSRRALIAAVARALRPGCKADHVVVLEGAQGIGKSTAIVELFGAQFTSDGLPSNVESKDAALSLRGYWAIEMAEMDAFSRSEVAALKDFLTKTRDDYRPPYGRETISQPRRCVFWATINPGAGGYLRDQTGNRRYWPVRCEAIDLDAIRADRDQIWAEAVAAYHAGERWHLVGDEVPAAEAEQEDRRDKDAWEAVIPRWIAANRNGEWVTNSDLLEGACALTPKDMGPGVTKRLGLVMKALGAEVQRSADRKTRLYRLPVSGPSYRPDAPAQPDIPF